MSTASLKFRQGALVGGNGLALFVVLGGGPVVAANVDDAGVGEWTFTVVDVPPGSAVPTGIVQDGATPTWTFTPDLPGGYLIQLDVKDGHGVKATDLRCVGVKTAAGRFIPPFDAPASALNFAGGARGWAPHMEAWLARTENSISVFNAQFYGAVGDGVADDTAAIIAAIAAIPPTTGGVLFLPPGKFKITSTITIADANVSIQGSGGFIDINNARSATTIFVSGNFPGIVYAATNTNTYSRDTFIRDLCVLGTGAGVNQIGVVIDSSKINWMNSRVTNCGSHGIELRSCTTSHFVNVVSTFNSGSGWHFKSSASNIPAFAAGAVNACTFLACGGVSNVGDGWLFDLVDGTPGNGNHTGNVFIGCDAEDNAGWGIHVKVTGSPGNAVSCNGNNWISIHEEANGLGSLKVEAGSVYYNHFHFAQLSTGEPVFLGGDWNTWSGNDVSNIAGFNRTFRPQFSIGYIRACQDNQDADSVQIRRFDNTDDTWLRLKRLILSNGAAVTSRQRTLGGAGADAQGPWTVNFDISGEHGLTCGMRSVDGVSDAPLWHGTHAGPTDQLSLDAHVVAQTDVDVTAGTFSRKNTFDVEAVVSDPGSGTITLTADQAKCPRVFMGGGNPARNLTVVFPDPVGQWDLIIGYDNWGGFSLTLQSGAKTHVIATPPILSIIRVASRGSSTLFSST